jgi:hypothetical protein
MLKHTEPIYDPSCVVSRSLEVLGDQACGSERSELVHQVMTLLWTTASSCPRSALQCRVWDRHQHTGHH